MRRSRRFLVLLPLALSACGCALVGGAPPERYGGGATLSEAAAEAARDSSDKHRRLDVGDRAPTYVERSEVESGVDVTTELSDEPTAPRKSRPGRHDWHIGMFAGGGSFGGQGYEGYGFGGAGFGSFVAPHVRLDLAFHVLSPNLTEESVAGQGLTNEHEIAGDFSARFYLTPPHTFLGVYPMMGVRMGTLFWTYRNPVQVIADGAPKTITDDYLNYLGLYFGIGLSLAQTRHFSTGVNLTAGFRGYDQTTFEGFQNDLFPTTGYTQLALEVCYRF